MVDTSYFESLDDTTLELVCQKLIDEGDYKTIALLVQTEHRMKKLCQKFVEMFHDDQIVVLISNYTHSDSRIDSLRAYITLDHLHSFIDQEIGSGLVFAVSLPILNQSIGPDGDLLLEMLEDGDHLIGIDDQTYRWDDPKTDQILRNLCKQKFLSDLTYVKKHHKL